MVAIVLGLLALVLAIAVLRWFAGADPRMLAKGLRWFGAGVLVLGAIGLAAIDRVGLAMLAGSMAWGLFTGGHVWPGGRPYRFGQGVRPRSSGNASSHVETEWLAMDLDHATGAMEGRVLKGAFAGPLENLQKPSLAQLLHDLEASDPESARLLEAYLGRRFGPDWRTSAEFSPVQQSNLSRKEALAVLGLSEGATGDEILAAHRRLILQIHPDRGGSSYLAAKINEARDVLLGG